MMNLKITLLYMYLKFYYAHKIVTVIIAFDKSCPQNETAALLNFSFCIYFRSPKL